MSIINDALRRAGRGGDEKRPQPGLGRNFQVGYERSRSRINWGPVFVVLVLLLITAPIIAPIFSSPFKKSPSASFAPTAHRDVVREVNATRTLPPAAPLATVSRRAQFGIEEMPRPAIARTPAFVLSGIVFSKEDSYAIVNDQVLRVGDQIRGAKLMAVAPDSITLDVQGQPVVIQAAE